MASGGPSGSGDFHILPKDILRIIIECLSRTEMLRLRLLNHWFHDFITEESNVYWFKIYFQHYFVKGNEQLLYESGLLVHDCQSYFAFCNHPRCHSGPDRVAESCPKYPLPYACCYVESVIENHHVDSRFQQWESDAKAIFEKHDVSSPGLNRLTVFVRAYTLTRYLLEDNPHRPQICFSSYPDHWNLDVSLFSHGIFSPRIAHFYQPTENYWRVFVKHKLLNKLRDSHGVVTFQRVDEILEACNASILESCTKKLEKLRVNYEVSCEAVVKKKNRELHRLGQLNDELADWVDIRNRYGITDEELTDLK